MKRPTTTVLTCLVFLILVAGGVPGGSAESQHDGNGYDWPPIAADMIKKWLDSPPCPLTDPKGADASCDLSRQPSWGDVVEWVWRDFFYLVGRDPGGYRFEKFGDTVDLFPATEGTRPTAFPGRPGEHLRQQATSRGVGPHHVDHFDGPGQTEHTLPPVEGIQQAAALVPVVDRNARWLHYSVKVNKPEWDYIANPEDSLYTRAGYNRKGRSWVVEKEDPELAEGKCIVVPEDPAKDSDCFVAKGPEALTITLPAGSVELKMAWRVLETCDLPDSPPKPFCIPEDASRYVTIQAPVDPYGPGAGDETKVENVTLGLVGMHIMHKTANHPDWVWATFELRENAPDCPSWTFVPHSRANMFCLPCPIPLASWTGQPEDPRKEKSVTLPDTALRQAGQGKAVLTHDPPSLLCTDEPDNFKFGVPPLYNPKTCLADPIPTEVCRSVPIQHGVAALNREVRMALQGLAARASGAERKLYAALAEFELVGVLWFDQSCRQHPKCREAEGSAIGLANTTMETFEQHLTWPISSGAGTGCTVCHGKNQWNPNPYTTNPIATGIADRSFVFSHIRQKGSKK